MTTAAPERVRLDIEGMTCAGCVSRVEKSLSGVDGVSACAVNLATDEAAVTFDPNRAQVDDLIDAVSSIGYGAQVHDHAGHHAPARPVRLVVAAALTVPLTLLVMVPALHFDGLGVGRARPVDTGRALGRLAVPSCRGAERASSARDDGHAGLDRNARRLGMVGDRPRRRYRRRHVLRGWRRDHDADPPRPLSRGPGHATRRRGDHGAARARCEGGARAARRRRDARADRGAPPRRPLRRAAGREDRHRRHRREAASRPSTSRC